MHNRCSNPHNSNYYRYGGRGIRVCDEWSEYGPFRAWSIANGYADGLTIDRINNDGPYSPDNCRWATWEVQRSNTRRNVKLQAFGEIKTMAEWVQDPRCLVQYSTLRVRIVRHKWDTERAITTPLHGNRINLRKTHCSRGHELVPGNLLVSGRNGGRACATCVRETERARWRATRDAKG